MRQEAALLVGTYEDERVFGPYEWVAFAEGSKGGMCVEMMTDLVYIHVNLWQAKVSVTSSRWHIEDFPESTW
jgi:hypothetical protein